MKQLYKKWAGLALIVAILLTFLPPGMAQAASTLTIKELYAETDNVGTSTEKPHDDSKVTRITQLPFTIKVDIAGVTESQVPSIYYVIKNMNSGVETTEKNNKALLITSNEIQFANVQLTEGLNKIIVMLGDTNAFTSAPAWVYYTPTTNLSNITINDVPLVDGKMYPTDRGPLKSGTTGIQIKTDASNANSVQATLTGDSQIKQGFKGTDGSFYFTGDDKYKTSATCTSVTSFCLNPGDNIFKFDANNDTNQYQVSRKLWYDNGKPFAFNGTISDGTNTFDLVKEPVLNSSALHINASLKSDLDTSGSMNYKYADVYINGQPVASGIDLSSLSSSSGSVTGSTYTVAYSSALSRDTSSDMEYRVQNFALDITNIPGSSSTPNPQKVTFKFRDSANNLVPIISEYKFSFVDPNKPYIDKVTQLNGAIQSQLSLTDTNPVSELPATFYVYANDKTKSVKVYIDGALYTADLPSGSTGDRLPESGSNPPRFIIQLQGVTDGNKKLTVELSSTDPADTSVYSTDYSLKVNNAPYIIVNNISNNMSIKKSDDLKCGTTDGCISGRVVNFFQDVSTPPALPLNSIKVYMNDQYVTLDSTSADTVFDPTTNAFTLPLSSIGTNTMTEGKNILKFEVYLNGSTSPITVQSYTIYLFSTDAPQFTSIKPIESGTSGTQFVNGSMPDTYSTTEHSVSFSGLFSSLTSDGTTPSNVQALTLIVHTKDATGNALVYQETMKNGNLTDRDYTVGSNTVTTDGRSYFVAFNNLSIDNQNFKTTSFKLPDSTDVVFEFRITNASNITATKSITITRQNVPYTIVQPMLIQNGSSLQANINSNFYEIIIAAENADSVVFGKESATKKTVNSVDEYHYKVKNLKAGSNTIKFTVNRGTSKVTGSFILYYTNTNVQGAEVLADMNTKFKMFNSALQLSFPKDTKLMRYLPDSNNNQFITSNRQVLFGIADSDDGRVDKTLYPTTNGYFKSKVAAKTLWADRFLTASPLYYMDAGFIPAPSSSSTTTDDLQAGLTGEGLDPYDASISSRSYFNRLHDEQVVPTSEGTLTLNFDPAIRLDAGRYVTVFYYDIYPNYSGVTSDGWKDIGGVVDASKHTITVPFQKFGYYQVMYMNKTFDDVTGHAFARNELETLFSKGVMKAKTTYTFAPNDSITRGEFAQILVKIFKLPLNYSGNGTFQDVFKIEDSIGLLYDYKYIETAARAGIVRGQASNRFNPGDSLTRQDAAVMIARAANMKLGTDLNKSLANLQKAFTDGDKIESYSRPAVEAVVKAGLMEGIENALLPGAKKTTVRFDPTELMTRAQASVFAYRVMKQQKMVP